MKDRVLNSGIAIWGICFGMIVMMGCSSQQSIHTSQTPPSQASEIPDYSNLYYWAAHPYKTDPSDSTPEPYRDFTKDSSVDVFFIYPTSYTDGSVLNAEDLSNPDEQKKWNASVNDVTLNEKTDNASILFQASLFNRYRVFAPRYRQAHYQSFFIPDSLSKPFFETAFADVDSAFSYYLQHYNHGRPFIIASHSQGTVHAARLIEERIENTPIEQQLVAAYLPGIPIPETRFSTCKPCEEAKQTACFVSWRTFKKGYEPSWTKKEQQKAAVINPLTWTSDEELVKKQQNKGAVLFKFNKPKANAVSAQVHGNILWASKPHFWGSLFFTRKNYHIGDYNLYWKNVRDNVDERVAAYKEKQGLAATNR